MNEKHCFLSQKPQSKIAGKTQPTDFAINYPFEVINNGVTEYLSFSTLSVDVLRGVTPRISKLCVTQHDESKTPLVFWYLLTNSLYYIPFSNNCFSLFSHGERNTWCSIGPPVKKTYQIALFLVCLEDFHAV